MKDLIGKRFSMLVVTGPSDIKKTTTSDKWDFICDCGKIYSGMLSNVIYEYSHVKSCGCLRKKTIKDIGKRVKTHGCSRDKKLGYLYRTYQNMKIRCTKPNCKSFKDYGGRGIRVCDRWAGPNGFPEFFSDVGERPGPGFTIDRINVDGDYCPGNVRWLDRKGKPQTKEIRYSQLVVYG